LTHANPHSRPASPPSADGQGPGAERLTVAVEELRFRPCDLAAAAPCLLTLRLARGATPQRVQLFDVSGCGSGGGESGALRRVSGDDTAGDCREGGGEPVEGVTGARLVATSAQLRPGESHTFKINGPGERLAGCWRRRMACSAAAMHGAPLPFPCVHAQGRIDRKPADACRCMHGS
jgi:hypothetical protein